jgi:PAS domain S-box-containing protein
MAVPNKPQKQVPAPALYRLLSDSARSRAALDACGFPIAMLDARAAARPVTYVNAAFEKFFGYAADDVLERPLAALLFRGDEPLVHRMLAEPNSRWKLRAWGKDDALRYVEVSLGAVRSGEDELTQWVVAFSDRAEVEQLRSELEGLRSLAAGP